MPQASLEIRQHFGILFWTIVTSFMSFIYKKDQQFNKTQLSWNIRSTLESDFELIYLYCLHTTWNRNLKNTSRVKDHFASFMYIVSQ